MQRVSISELSTLRWSFFQDSIRYASYGFGSMGVWRQKTNELDEGEASDLLFEMNMNVSSVHWAGGFTGSDGRSYVEAIDDAIDAIQLAGRLGADCLIIHPGSRNGHTYSHAYRLFHTALLSLVPVANDFGVKLAVEPMLDMSSSDWTFFDTFKSSLDLVSQFSSEHVGLVLDLFHVGLNREVYVGLNQFIDHVALVQLADRRTTASQSETRQLLGKGDVAIVAWMQRLQQLGYEGMFEVELQGAGLECGGYHQMLDSTLDFLQHETVQGSLAVGPKQAELIRVKRSHKS